VFLIFKVNHFFIKVKTGDCLLAKSLKGEFTAPYTQAACGKSDSHNAGGTTQVPPLDESSWINAANNNDGVAPAFSSYTAAPKWDAAAFNALPVE